MCCELFITYFLRGLLIDFQSKLKKRMKHIFFAGCAQTRPINCWLFDCYGYFGCSLTLKFFEKVSQLQQSVSTAVLSVVCSVLTHCWNIISLNGYLLFSVCFKPERTHGFKNQWRYDFFSEAPLFLWTPGPAYLLLSC